MSDTAVNPDTRPAARKGRSIRSEALQLSPALQEAVLATPLQRILGIGIDLIVIATLSVLAGPILGVFTGLTVASLGSRRVSDARFWLVFRWILIGLGGMVALLSGFLVAGAPIVRTNAFNIATDSKQETAQETYMLPPNPSYSELQQAVARLEKRSESLSAENKALRERDLGKSLLTTTADFGRTLGLTFGWAGVYFTLCTAWLGGRTFGKFLVRTRVMRLDGRPITPMDAFIRNGGYAAGLATGLIGFMSVLWDPNRRAIEDKIAWTVVVRTGSVSGKHITPSPADSEQPPPPSDSPPDPS